MLKHIKKQYPQAKTIHTRNTDSTEAMNHINNLLGFKRIRRTTVVQVHIDQLKIYLQKRISPESDKNIIIY